MAVTQSPIQRSLEMKKKLLHKCQSHLLWCTYFVYLLPFRSFMYLTPWIIVRCANFSHVFFRAFMKIWRVVNRSPYAFIVGGWSALKSVFLGTDRLSDCLRMKEYPIFFPSIHIHSSVQVKGNVSLGGTFS